MDKYNNEFAAAEEKKHDKKNDKKNDTPLEEYMKTKIIHNEELKLINEFGFPKIKTGKKVKSTMDNELSYEDEQLQRILMNEMKEKRLKEERMLKEEQTKEYLESLKIDEKKNKEAFDEVSPEEMRRVRLLRFSK